MTDTSSWKNKALLVGILVGALTGLVAAIIVIQRSEKQDSHPRLTASEGVRLGMGVLGLLKLITDSGGKK